MSLRGYGDDSESGTYASHEVSSDQKSTGSTANLVHDVSMRFAAALGVTMPGAQEATTEEPPRDVIPSLPVQRPEWDVDDDEEDDEATDSDYTDDEEEDDDDDDDDDDTTNESALRQRSISIRSSERIAVLATTASATEAPAKEVGARIASPRLVGRARAGSAMAAVKPPRADANAVASQFEHLAKGALRAAVGTYRGNAALVKGALVHAEGAAPALSVSAKLLAASLDNSGLTSPCRVKVASDLAPLYTNPDGHCVQLPDLSAPKFSARDEVADSLSRAGRKGDADAWLDLHDSIGAAVRILGLEGESEAFDNAANAAVVKAFSFGLRFDTPDAGAVLVMSPFDGARFATDIAPATDDASAPVHAGFAPVHHFHTSIVKVAVPGAAEPVQMGATGMCDYSHLTDDNALAPILCSRRACVEHFSQISAPSDVLPNSPLSLHSDKPTELQTAVGAFVKQYVGMRSATQSQAGANLAALVASGLGSSVVDKLPEFNTLLSAALLDVFDVLTHFRSCRSVKLAHTIASEVRQLSAGKLVLAPNSVPLGKPGQLAAGAIVGFLFVDCSSPKLCVQPSGKFRITQPLALSAILVGALASLPLLPEIAPIDVDKLREQWKSLAEVMEHALGKRPLEVFADEEEVESSDDASAGESSEEDKVVRIEDLDDDNDDEDGNEASDNEDDDDDETIKDDEASVDEQLEVAEGYDGSTGDYSSEEFSEEFSSDESESAPATPRKSAPIQEQPSSGKVSTKAIATMSLAELAALLGKK